MSAKTVCGQHHGFGWFEGQSPFKEKYREELDMLPLFAERSWASGFEPARGPGGFVQIRLQFFALKKDGLPALVIQFGFSPYTSNSPETLVEPKLPPVLFPRVPTYTLPLATVGTVNLTAFPA